MLLRLMLFMATLLTTGGVARAEEAFGVLQVSAPVEGAVVHVDNVEVGPTPLTHYIAPGNHTVRVAAPGFDPYVRKVNVSANLTATVDAQLTRGGATAEFFVRPAGANVTLDGQPIGVAPIRLTGVAAGTHRYAITHPGFETVEGDFHQVPGGNALVVHELASSQGRWTITSRPAGAQVWMDGERVGKTPLELRDVPSDVHVVVLQLDDHPLFTQSVDTSDGSRGEVNAKLDGSSTKVTLRTDSGDATLSLNGVEVGQGRKAKLALMRGDWELVAEAPGAKPLREMLDVPITGSRIWKVSLAASGEDADSTVASVPPLTRTWWFWTAVGAGAAGSATTAAVVAVAMQPEPQPTGDVIVTLP